MCELSQAAIAVLPAEAQQLWQAELAVAEQRCKDHNIDKLLEEFRGQLAEPGKGLRYELAFRPGWYEEALPLYNCRWWINGQTAGVYFIYNSDNDLEYVGTSCGGTLGHRIHLTGHREYAHSVDVVLFERQWPHFALAFEALAISRLKPPRNVKDRGFMAMRIEPAPPFNQYWRQDEAKPT